MAQHHQKIADRDQKIFNIYNSPQHITHTKFEINKNTHVDELNDALFKKEQQRQNQQANDKDRKKMALLSDMI